MTQANDSRHLRYRLATASDLNALGELRWAMWREDGEHPAQQSEAQFIQSFSAWLEPRLGQEWFVWCADHDGRIVSTIYVQLVQKLPKPSAPTDAFGYITSVYTLPDSRNQGVGARLLEQVTSWALDSDIEFLLLWPSEDSQPFWQRGGFATPDALLRQIRPYIN